jgi:glycosyltransferase involved in cell wall biosynthesis
MKIVVFSNLYPPLFLGGYEIGASQIVAELHRRGHETLILSAHEYFFQQPTSGYLHRTRGAGEQGVVIDTGLCVLGSLPGLFRHHPLLAARRLAAVPRVRRRYNAAVRDFRPDLALVFNPLGVVAPVLDDLIAYSRASGVPVHAYVSDNWLARWPEVNPLWPMLESYRRAPNRYVRTFWRMVGRLLYEAGLMPEPVPFIDQHYYCSDYIRRLSRRTCAGIAGHEVVHWGLQHAGRLPALPAGHFDHAGPLTLVFAGQLLEHKGLAVLLRALRHCRAKHRLVVIGDEATEYAANCKRLAAKLGVLEQTQFLGRKKNEEMLELLARSGHVLVVPSLWDEPFSIVVLEGMGLGLPVIASDTGGTAEAVTDGETGFLFPRGDAKALAAVINRLEADRPLCRRAGSRAREMVRRRFTMDGMVDQIVAHFPSAPVAAGVKAAA